MSSFVKIMVLVPFLALTGCNKGDDSDLQYLGNWANIKYAKRTLAIERNSDAYMIRETTPDMRNGNTLKTKNIPATLKSGQLQVQTGFGTMSFTIDSSTGNLTNGKHEYKRIN